VARRRPIRGQLHSTTDESERALLIAVQTGAEDQPWSTDDSLAELKRLAESAGAVVVGERSQRLDTASGTYYVGKGKLKELQDLKATLDYSLVVADDELTPRQQRAIEDELDVRVIDRTALILDIFAHRARSHEGKLQVELAQHKYLLPRLIGRWQHLERLGGGIGTRGPGESQLETDRRLIRLRISRLERDLEAVRRQREVYRARRRRERVPIVALVGYTNAGKSTLFNTLSRASVLVEDRLFSTLDPVTRKVRLPGGTTTLLSDTVGFIHKLPPSIIAAFRTTLEELDEADLLLHVVDITHRDASRQHATVEQILADIGLAAKPVITALNKVDLLDTLAGESNGLTLKDRIAGERTDFVPVSAVTGWNLDELLERIESRLTSLSGSTPWT